LATQALDQAPRPKKRSLAPDLYERVLAYAALLLLAAVLAALARGRDEWSELSALIWGHLLTIIVALALTPVLLLRRRGDRLHRQLGWVWAAALAGTALLTFGIRQTNDGSLGFIHILSAWTLIQVPLIVLHARAHRHDKHRGAVRAMVTGALLIAGFFTFPFGRLLGNWLLG
jgi:uncharacterized membrane protein